MNGYVVEDFIGYFDVRWWWCFWIFGCNLNYFYVVDLVGIDGVLYCFEMWIEVVVEVEY